MCGCNRQSVGRIQSVKLSALTPFATRLGSAANSSAGGMSVGIATMTTGEQIWYASAGGNFATDLFGYELLGSVSFTADEITVKAAASKDGKEVASFTLVLSLDNVGINKMTYLKTLDAKSDGTLKPQNALADCLKRHGKDIGICCALFGCDDTCLEALAVGVAACCLINGLM